MKFGDYITEKAFKPSAALLKNAQKEVAKEFNVKPRLMTFIGVQDEIHTVGRRFLWFRIDDPKHKEYRSTKTYEVK